MATAPQLRSRAAAGGEPRPAGTRHV